MSLAVIGVMAFLLYHLPFSGLLATFGGLFLARMLCIYRQKPTAHSVLIILQIGCLVALVCVTFLKSGPWQGVIASLAGVVLCRIYAFSITEATAEKENSGLNSTALQPSSTHNLDIEMDIVVSEQHPMSPADDGLTCGDGQTTWYVLSLPWNRQYENHECQRLSTDHQTFLDAHYEQFLMRLHKAIAPAGNWQPCTCTEPPDYNLPRRHTLYAIRTAAGQCGLQSGDLCLVFPHNKFTVIRLTQFTCRGRNWYTVALENNAKRYEIDCELGEENVNVHGLYRFVITLANAWKLKIRLSYENMN